MTGISTGGHASTQAQPPLLPRGRERIVILTFLLASAVATFGWLYLLAQGAMAVANWLIS
jgi:hypothetical protein